MTTTCPFRPNQIAYVNLFPGISSILDNLNSWRIENTESSRRVYSNMRSTREILSGHSAPYFHDDRLHRHNDRLRYCELPNVWHINIDFTAMKTVVAAIFCAPHGKTTFSAHSFYPSNNRSQNISAYFWLEAISKNHYSVDKIFSCVHFNCTNRHFMAKKA